MYYKVKRQNPILFLQVEIRMVQKSYSAKKAIGAGTIGGVAGITKLGPMMERCPVNLNSITLIRRFNKK